MKKRILTVALVVALLATCFAGTYAYLKDTKAQKNTFTIGNVYITLDEAKVDGTGRTTETQDYKLFPAMAVTKDPTITVASDSEDAYIAAIVTITGPKVLKRICGAFFSFSYCRSRGRTRESSVAAWGPIPSTCSNSSG